MARSVTELIIGGTAVYTPTTTMTQPDRPKQALQTSPFKLAPRHRFARFFACSFPFLSCCVLDAVTMMLM